MRQSFATPKWLIPVVVVFLLILLDLKKFSSWDQVNLLWESEANILLLLLSGHPHGPRFIISYPGFFLEQKMPALGFSLYILLFCLINFYLFKKILNIFLQKNETLISSVVFTSAHLLMNGRGVIAWTAWLLCIWVCFSITFRNNSIIKKTILGALSCCLATVSTGVFILVVIAYTFFVGRIFWGGGFGVKNLIIGVPPIFLIASFAVDYFVVAVDKNIEFYGGGFGGVLNMLEHGMGTVFTNVSILILFAAIIIVACVLVSLYYLIFGRRTCVIEKLGSLCFMCGLFGYTVLTLIIPVILINSHKIKMRKFK
jgi:hypothetical protein